MDASVKEEADPGRLLDGIRSMNIADVDRARLVNCYLDALIRAVEPKEKSPQKAARGPSEVGFGLR